jgi:aspartokinase/homoserine dehydrogenase 1
MQVLKFGGTSVGSSKNINKVITILEDYSKKDKVICVVSAIGGITDKLLKAGNLAKDNNKNYKTEYKSIKAKHITVLEELIPQNNTAITKELEDKLKKLKNLLDGIFLINELSPQTSDRLVSFGDVYHLLLLPKL